MRQSAGRQPDGAPTDAQARAAIRRVVRELFDVPAVLRGQKKLRELAGIEWVAGSVLMNMVSVGVNSRWMDNGRKVAHIMYLRDMRAFVRIIVGQMSLSVLYQFTSAAGWWMRTQISIAWRKRLTERLHAVYFADTLYYRQTTWGSQSIADPAQRIAADVTSLVGNYDGLTMLLQSYISTGVGVTNAVWRLWFQMPGQRWLVPFIFAWSYGNLLFRNWFSPAMWRSNLMAKGSKISGAYRDAQNKLLQHAESIISFDGVSAEKRRLFAKLEESIGNSREMTAVFLRENLAMNLVGEVFSATMTHALIHVPMLAMSYPGKVAADAAEGLRMQANATLLGEMAFKGQLIRNCQSYVGHLSRLGRSMLQGSGSAIRIAELLDIADRAPEIPGKTARDANPAADAAIEVHGVSIETPSRVRLATELSFRLQPGDCLLVYGASGVGKTSLCRTLKGLWPGANGRLSMCVESVMFLPQYPFIPASSSWQDLLAYPDRCVPERTVSAELVREVLTAVELDHLMSNEDEGVPELSLSEKQQLGIARVLLKRPRYVVLDESTSAVDVQLEERLYQQLSRRDILFVTVSHRPSLLRYHTRILKIKKDAWSINPIENTLSDFPSPLPTRRSSPRTPRRERAADSAACRGELASKESSASASTSLPAARSKKAMPQLSDFARTIKLAKLVVPRLTWRDVTLWRVLGSTALMGINIWVQTSFISAIPGILQSYVLQSDMRGYLRFTAQAWLVRCVNMLIGVGQMWLQMGISITWRERLTRTLTERFLHNNNFYAVAHVDKRIPDADQRIAVEVNQFVQSLSMLYSPWRGLVRTGFDAVAVSVLIMRVHLPLSGVLTMLAYGTVGMGLIKMFAPDFTHFNVEQERSAAEFRAAHTRINNSLEAIAFADGGRHAEQELNIAHRRLLAVIQRSSNRSSLWTPVQQILTSSTPMYIQQILPFLWSFGQGSNADVLANRGGAQMQETTQYIQTLISRAFQTMTQVMGMHQQFAWLFGSARRLSDLLLVLDELDDAAVEAMATRSSSPGGQLGMKDVTVRAPDSRPLLRNVSFSVEAHGDSNMLVVGPHGVGKSAVLRTLSGLWPAADGCVLWPEDGGASSRVAVVPQEPLVPTTPISLLDLMTYPQQLAPGSKGAQEAMATLEALMERLGVTYLVERSAPEGFSATKSWETELSKGEAQCIGLLRLLYHQPQWALLDECTSAMAHELQSQCYQLLAERGIATISAVSQHDEEALEMLRPFHAQELTLTLLDPPDQITVGAKYAGEGIAGWTVTDLKERPAAATDRVEPLDLAGSTEHCAEGEGEGEAEAEAEGEGECHDAGEEEEGDAMGRAGK